MADDTRSRPFVKMAAIAAAVIIVGAGIALYVNAKAPGNNGAGQVEADGTGQCGGKAAEAKALGAKAVGEVAAMSPADPPISLARLSFDGPDGKPITLAKFSGKTVLLNVWATWCAPCRAEIPALDALERQKGGPGFQVVAVNVDTGGSAKPRKFLADEKALTLGLYRDDTLGVFNDLKRRGLALGLPVTLIIDKDGCMLTHMNGPAAWASNDAQRLIEAAVSG